MKRNYVSWTTNTAEIGSYLVIEENLSEQFWAQPGDHTDGWQWGGGERDNVIVRNKVRLNDTNGITGCYSFFNDFAGGSGDYGFYDFIWDNNYIAGGGYSVYLPSSSRPTQNFKARGNRWSTEFHPNSGVYNAVYPTSPMSPTANGNEWLNNRWLDGARAGQIITIPGY
jgi:hypothetical protein